MVRRAADGDRAGTERPGDADLKMAVIELLPAQIGLDADAGRGAAIEREVLDRCQRVVMCATLRIDTGPIDRRWLQRRASAAPRPPQRGTDARPLDRTKGGMG